MYKYKWFYPCILLLVLFACSQKENTTLETIKINPDEFVNVPEKGTDWIETVKFLPIISDGEHFIPDDAQLKFRDDYILAGNMDKILIFNSEGEFINEISKKGKGPEEYLFIGDYDLIPASQEIVIIGSKKLHFYTINGDFIEAVNIPFMRMSVAAISKDRFACMLGRERSSWAFDQPLNYQLVILNRKGEIIDKRFEFPFSSVNFPSHNEIQQSADHESLLFHMYFDYHVYSIDQAGKIDIKYTLDYGDLASDTAFLQKPELETMPNIFPHVNGRLGVSNSVSESSNTLCLSIGSDKKQKMTYQMINRNSRNQFTLIMGEDAVLSEFHGWPIYPTRGATGDFLYQPMQAIDVVEIMETLSNDQKNKLAKFPGFKKLSSVKEDDELVFFFYKVKDF